MTQAANDKVSSLFRIIQNLALGVIILFLTRFIQSVDSLTETVGLLKTEVKVGQSQSMDKLIYIEKTVNDLGERVNNLETFYWQGKTEAEISKAKAIGRNQGFKSIKK
jgi:hypothetical protein